MALDHDFQFELLDYAFGRACPVIIDGEGGFDPGVAGWRTQDQPYPQGDGLMFGRDFLDGPTWAWSLGTNQIDVTSALATLAEFKTIWRADATRREPGAVLPLRYRLDGRVRRVYGRPRRLAHPPQNAILTGWIPITCDFVCADDRTYADVTASASLGVTPSSQGGLTTPLVDPLTTVEPGAQSFGEFHSDGDASTWPVITFTGPVANPYVLIDGMRCGIRNWLPADKTVTIDSAPWARTALDELGNSFGGRLDRFTYLDRMELRPGDHSFIFGGASTTWAATATVEWRSAYNAL
jgi:hypothetical protein